MAPAPVSPLPKNVGTGFSPRRQPSGGVQQASIPSWCVEADLTLSDVLVDHRGDIDASQFPRTPPLWPCSCLAHDCNRWSKLLFFCPLHWLEDMRSTSPGSFRASRRATINVMSTKLAHFQIRNAHPKTSTYPARPLGRNQSGTEQIPRAVEWRVALEKKFNAKTQRREGAKVSAELHRIRARQTRTTSALGRKKNDLHC